MKRLIRVVTPGILIAAVLCFGWMHGEYAGNYEFFESSRLPWTIAYIVILLGAGYALGLPDEPVGGYRWAFGAAATAGAIAALAISVAQLVVGAQLLPRFVVAWSTMFAVGWYWLFAAISDDVRRRHFVATKIAVIGDSSEIATLQSELENAPEKVAQVVLSISLDDLDSVEDVNARISDVNADVVVLDREAQTNESLLAQVVTAHQQGIRVRTLSLFYEQWLQKLPVSELERISLLFDIGELHHRGYGQVKRVGDVIAGFAIAAIACLITPVVVVLNLFANRGPVLFRQQRVGRNGEEFTLLKFRTMRPETARSDWTAADDDRVTAFGKLLRRSHLDELPQGWNILRGDLSLVGPRPEQPVYVDQLKRTIPFYDVRHLVRPGLTGWAQVRHRYGASVVDAKQKLQYDFFYLRHQGLALDMQIAFRTIRSVVLGRGR